MRPAPSFERAEQALEDALASLPLPASTLADRELRAEYAALVLFVLQTKERLALLGARWEAKGLPQAAAPCSLAPPPEDIEAARPSGRKPPLSD